jgi:integration host factor subunit alpha
MSASRTFLSIKRSGSDMTLTKANIIDAIPEELGLTRKKSAEVLETLLEIIKRTLGNGEDVLISGFGKFCVNGKNARRGRNPATGDEMMLDPRKVVTFKCSGKLREKLNGKD